jgi:hypothetical protein
LPKPGQAPSTHPARRWTSSTCEQGVHHLIAYCLNDFCRHQAIVDVSKYPGDTPVPLFRSKVKCGKRGARNNRIDVRPNWKEKPGMPDNWQGRDAWKR